ncbi:MAG: hypothetical protein RL376_1653, partial [Verrucomicrobiota bacterium]
MKLEIPAWWTSATLNELITHAIGGDWGSAPETEDDKLTPVSCIRCTEIRNWDTEHGATAALRKIKKTSLENRRLQEGDILLEVSGGGPEQPVGRTILVDRQCLSFRNDLPKVPTNFLRLLRPTTELEPRFLNRYLRFFYDSGEITNYQGGSNNLRNLKFQDYVSITIPLPPLAEQKRIVAKIEVLFSELEAGEASLRKARRQLGVYRQSLLKQAFEGKLTAKWRTQNPDKVSSVAANDVSPEELNGFAELPRGWRYTRFGHSIRHIDAGKSFRCEERRPKPDEIGVAKVSAVTWGEYDEAESKTCIDPEKMNPAYFIRPGDFIL